VTVVGVRAVVLGARSESVIIFGRCRKGMTISVAAAASAART